MYELVFEGGGGGDGAKEQPPSKTSTCGSFLRLEVVVVWWRWCQGVTTLENELHRLVFEGDGGSSSGGVTGVSCGGGE